MDKELIQEYLRRYDQSFSLPKNNNTLPVLCIDLTAESLCNNQQKFADWLLKNAPSDAGVFSSGALIFYGYRMGAVRLKGKNECITRQGGYKDNAILTYSLDEILDEETDEENPDTHVSHIIEWAINPKSNTDIADEVIGKMIVPMVINLYKTSTPDKRTECTVVMPPISEEIEIQDWAPLFSGIKARNLQINIVNYGHLLTLTEDERQYIFQYQTDGSREYVIVSAYEVIRGHNTCLGSLAFDVNDFDRQYVLKDIKPISLTVDSRQECYEKKSESEPQNDWTYIPCRYPVHIGFNSFLGNNAATFGREYYKLSKKADGTHEGANEIKTAFHKNEALQATEICARLLNEQNLYNISLGDLVYVASILQRDKAFVPVTIGTKKDYRLGTLRKFAPLIDVERLSEIPSNYNSLSWRIKDKSKKTIPYFDLKKMNVTENQIIESVVGYYDHCTTDTVADELLYYRRNGEDPSAFFVTKVFMYMSQMDSLVIESRNEFITSVENVDEVEYQEIDKSFIPVTKPKVTHPQRSNMAASLIDNRVLDMTIGQLGLSVRSYNCLNRANIRTVRDIIKLSRADLYKIRNLGRRNQEEVIEKIHKLGLTIAGE